MKDSNSFYKSAHFRALFHTIGLPILLFTLVAITDKSMSLIIPSIYILVIGIFQYIRLKSTNRLEHKVYSRTFFTYLKNIVTIVAILALENLLMVVT